ncbi:MAG: iron-sulfur protein, partial [Actinomycetia bacterium]|nr:iron-sulfur protein [Actinomycetes bacterium]
MNTRRIKPHQLVLAFGAVMAIVTVLSGIAASVFDFHEESQIHRTVFGNIPDGLKIVFYTVMPILLVYGAYMFAMRVKNWERGQPDRRQLRSDNSHRRAKDWRAGVMMQTLLRDPGAGVMHLM